MSTRALCVLFLAAVATRLLVCAAAMIAFDIPLDAYTDKGDGQSYKRYALMIRHQPTEFTSYDTRVFPGYPLLIAATGLRPGIAALAIDFLSVGAAAVLAARLFNDIRIGWAMVFLIPHYVINSSLAMSEAPLLAFSLGAFVLAVRSDRPLVGGLLMGFAGLVRPMAAFAAIGYLAWAWASRRKRPAIAFGAAAAIVVATGLVGLHLAFGDALRGVRAYANEPGAYNGSIFTWPFGSLITTPLHDASAHPRIPYIWIHVLITLLACGLLLRRVRRPRDLKPTTEPLSADLAWLAAPWLVANTFFVLCIGSHWGFDHFPRFTIPAQTAMFYAYARWLPTSKWVWTVIGIVTVAIGIWGVKNSP